jgi:putative ABC transport system permease protein
MELFEERKVKSGKLKADTRFIVDVLLLFRPAIIKPAEGSQNLNTYGMYKSYFKIGWRNLLKNKGYSFINIGGLALGMAVAITIGLWVYDELSFNKYHHNYDRIAQVTKAGNWEGRKWEGGKYLPYPLINELKNNYGATFKHVVPISGQGGWMGVLATPDKILSKTGLYIGEDAPEMFTWKMIHGSWKGLDDLHSIMISQSTAKALFANENPIDKIVRVASAMDAKITGVYEDFPHNSEFYGIEFVQPWKFYEVDASWITRQGWENHLLWVYVQVQDNVTMAQASANVQEAEMNAIKNLAYMSEEMKGHPEITLLPMSDWHLFSEYKEGRLQNGPVQLVWFIGLIGVFVLLLACINFMNLSTARSEKRAKEVGIRKAIGSVRKQLIGQFFSESFLVVLIAFAFAITLVTLCLPSFNLLAAKQIQMPWQEVWFWLGCSAFLLTTGIVAGSYPALYLSSFNPAKVLKGAFRVNRYASIPRKALVVVQFTVSVMLIVCTGVIYSQLMYVKDRPVGYDREGLVMIRKRSDDYTTKADVLRAELKKTGVISEIAESGGEITQTWSHNNGFNWKGKDPSFEASMATLNVSPEFGKTVGWQFVDGRDFSADIASDSAGFILNEAAVKYLGLKNPVGETIRWTNRSWNMDQDFRVVGVIKDMIMNSPFEPVKPAVYLTYGYERWILLRITPGTNINDALPKIQSVFTSVIPDIPFDYKFADEEYASKFATEDRIGKLAALFAALAIGISCLGLLGLSSFVAEQRTKEIGIRKVLGASIGSLWQMLSREFVILVIISCLIATPVSYYILTRALQDYEYRTAIGWWIFVLAALGALLITLLTVSFQSIKAAVANPVQSLRSE